MNEAKKHFQKMNLVSHYLIGLSLCHSTYNYERMQASGVLHALAPSLEKIVW